MEWLRSKNPYFASTKFDRVCVTIFVLGVHLSFWYEVRVVLPSYNLAETDIRQHLVWASMFYFNVLTNLYKLITTRTDCRLAVIGSNETREWPFCDRCNIYKPPRSHHCKRCNTCILLRDHHCWFSGCCIGHSNYRYYLNIIFYMFVGAIYANLFHLMFFLDKLGHTKEFMPICVIMPHFGLMIGKLSLSEFGICVMTCLTLYCGAMITWLLAIQMIQLVLGQTKYEHAKKIKDYNHGILSNLTTVMGKRWYIAWICAFIPSPPVGNGTHYPDLVKNK